MKIAIKKGLLDMLPLNLAVLPWGILCGSLAIQNGFSALEAQLMSLLVFAGSAQLVAIELMAKDVSFVTLVITTFIISARHLLYGLSIRNKMIDKPLKWRGPIAFFLTDELFAFSHHHRAYQGKLRLVYALVAGASFYLAWNLWTFFGIVAGQYLPDLTNLGLDFAIAAIFIALVIPGITNTSTLVACIVSGLSMLYFKTVEFEFGLVAAALLGMTTGYLLQTKEDKS
ncbi:AzlC family ABC transporter permease [Pseudoalteromonas luteoviolacea]|uniref:AzlC family ABC transporter permease n=1 Tax=Pseudoalteromonas luteoviolacea TaxID=43657 RepID=UPI0011542ADE|nr:AzlC family ABC transporter permease [Pseudoalteromonas luteoviolacea]TQF70106.1 AzlC family ABC transporter permease [Pseudoalteromonas luteoviolacea]